MTSLMTVCCEMCKKTETIDVGEDPLDERGLPKKPDGWLVNAKDMSRFVCSEVCLYRIQMVKDLARRARQFVTTDFTFANRDVLKEELSDAEQLPT